MSKRYGALRFLGYGMLINSVFAFLVPVAAREGGVIWLSIVRFIQGLGEGPIVPCTHAMLAKWIPPTERSRMGAFVYAGKLLVCVCEIVRIPFLNIVILFDQVLNSVRLFRCRCLVS